MKTCETDVALDFWRYRECGKPAKYRVSFAKSGKPDLLVCGIHARHWKKYYPENVKPLKNEEPKPAPEKNETK